MVGRLRDPRCVRLVSVIRATPAGADLIFMLVPAAVERSFRGFFSAVRETYVGSQWQGEDGYRCDASRRGHCPYKRVFGLNKRE